MASLPFIRTRTEIVSVYATADYVMAYGKMCKTPQDLWDCLFDKAAPIVFSRITIPHKAEQNPEVAEYLRTHGATRFATGRSGTDKTEAKTTKVKQVSLEDF